MADGARTGGLTKPWELPAGQALNLAVQGTLHRIGHPHLLPGPQKLRPWSTHAGLAVRLIGELSGPFGCQWTVQAQAQTGNWIDGEWTVTITPTRAGENWYCEAWGRTLPEAFCRALVQELEAEPEDKEA